MFVCLSITKLVWTRPQKLLVQFQEWSVPSLVLHLIGNLQFNNLVRVMAVFLKWTCCQLPFLRLSIINFGDIKMKIISWSANSIEPRVSWLAWPYAGRKDFRFKMVKGLFDFIFQIVKD
jgi:hypothetical protein